VQGVTSVDKKDLKARNFFATNEREWSRMKGRKTKRSASVNIWLPGHRTGMTAGAINN
jgi:hypothetical protein